LQHPLDLAKVRMQTAHARIGLLHTLKNVFYNEGTVFELLCLIEGFLAMYNGLSASLLRQATYSTVRFGVYEELKEVYSEPGKPLSLGQLILMASVSGWYIYYYRQHLTSGSVVQ
jgi:solute carrier family 25 (mitochondrial dicarboxylate transporter), member 10